jgi:hypothetical protein
MEKLCHPGKVSLLTSGKSLPERTSPVRRFLAVAAVESVCVVLLMWAGFSDALTAWSGGYATAHPARHLAHWTVLFIGIALAIHAVYAYRRSWNPEAAFQGILGAVALLVGVSLLSSTDAGVSRQRPQPSSPVGTSTSTSSNTGTFCYSGGTCYLNGTPVSGHP